MNRKDLKRICFITTFSLLLAANGCSLKSDKQLLDNTNIDGNQTTQKDVLTEESGDDEFTLSQDSDTAATDSKETDAETIKRAATKEISIYTINETTLGVESVVALVPEDSQITPQLIIDQVKDSLADRLITVGIDEVTTEEDTVIVSFLADQPPLINIERGLEKTILDAIAQSLVDNLEDYPKVIFRVEGQAYSSDNLSFGLNEVYLDDNKTK